METSKTSVVWKTGSRRAKRSEIWGLRVVVQHIRGTFGLVVFKVMLRSFGALSIFRNLDLMIRDRRKHFGWLKQLNGKRYVVTIYISIGNHIWRVQ